MKIPGPILYLYEYRHVPEEVFLLKNDEDLIPWEGAEAADLAKKAEQRILPERLCMGIGTYRTREDGELYPGRRHGGQHVLFPADDQERRIRVSELAGRRGLAEQLCCMPWE